MQVKKAKSILKFGMHELRDFFQLNPYIFYALLSFYVNRVN